MYGFYLISVYCNTCNTLFQLEIIDYVFTDNMFVCLFSTIHLILWTPVLYLGCRTVFQQDNNPESLAPLPQHHWPCGSVVYAFGVCYPQPAFPAHNSTEDSTGHHRLIKHPEHSPADVERPQPSQKIEKAPSLPEEAFSVLYPVQFIITVDPEDTYNHPQCPHWPPG